MPRVSEDHLTARREQILAAARACFLRNGLHNTSMQDLIQEAGLSVGAVYRYFKSKNDIISAISETVAGSLATHLDEVAADGTLDLATAMERVVDILDDQLGNFPLAVQVWSEAVLDPAIGEIVRERYLRMREPFHTIAERAITRGELPAGADVAAVSAVLFGMIPGYALQRQLVGHPDRDTYLAGVRALLAR
ncbi:TetR/AcrR family transcriptional regulator [Actinoplanes sp. NPDC049548]|uniref:TetR/AcrR family transcriptional regulator n=1 Tax=Actinoplanes sp. NPDC049548 TaxID=3155152 RepID=UPI00342F1697